MSSSKRQAGLTPQAQPKELKAAATNLGSFSDAYRAAHQLEGEGIQADALVEKQFVVHKYFRRRSKFAEPGEAREYASVQIELEGQKRYFNTSSKTLMDQLERTAEAMPYRATLERKESHAGRKYLSLA